MYNVYSSKGQYKIIVNAGMVEWQTLQTFSESNSSQTIHTRYLKSYLICKLGDLYEEMGTIYSARD